VPPELEAVCLRALERDPEQRFKSAREMALALERAAERADLLADSHEVADLVRERFGAELELRRHAIQAYIAGIEEDTDPVWVNDLYSLPKLGEDAPPPAARSANTPDRKATHSGDITLAPSPASSAPISSGAASPALPTTAAGTAAERQPTPTPARRRGGWAIGAALLVGAVALVWGARRSDRHEAASARTEPAAASTAPEIRAAAVVPGPSLAPSGLASTVTVEPRAPEPAPERSAREPLTPPRGPARPAVAPNARPAPKKPSDAPRARPATNEAGLPIEQNPYRFR